MEMSVKSKGDRECWSRRVRARASLRLIREAKGARTYDVLYVRAGPGEEGPLLSQA